jgi:hypothetical protein
VKKCRSWVALDFVTKAIINTASPGGEEDHGVGPASVDDESRDHG